VDFDAQEFIEEAHPIDFRKAFGNNENKEEAS
jgi:hypothetical protein